MNHTSNSQATAANHPVNRHSTIFSALLAALLPLALPLPAQVIPSNSVPPAIGSAAVIAPQGGPAGHPKLGQGPKDAAALGWRVESQDQNSRTWARAAAGTNGVVRTNHLVELGAGSFKPGPGGQAWVPATEEITLLPNGGAAGLGGAHQVWFPSDITDVLTVQAPNHERVRLRVTGVSLFDGQKSVMIGTPKSCPAELVLNDKTNQILFADAFEGITASVIYTYTKSGLSQDLLLRAQIPDPASFGLGADGQPVRLQVLTEVLDRPTPEVKPVATNNATGLLDHRLTFAGTNGGLTMVRGKAFFTDGQKITSPIARHSGTPVFKSFQQLRDGNGPNGGPLRSFIVEEVPLDKLATDLKALPPADKPVAKADGILNRVSRDHLLPPLPAMKTDPTPTRVARLDTESQRGIAIDWECVAGYYYWYEFYSGYTYLVTSSAGFLDGQIDGGAVLKFTDGAGLYGNLYGDNSGGATLTSWCDDSIGDIIDGSDGSAYRVAAVAVSLTGPPDASLSTLTFKHLAWGILFDDWYNLDVFGWAYEFDDCGVAFGQAGDGSITATPQGNANDYWFSSIGTGYYPSSFRSFTGPLGFQARYGELLYANLSVDNNHRPSDIVLTWNGSASASWGANTVPGAIWMGPLPQTGAFVLSVPACVLGLEEQWLSTLTVSYRSGGAAWTGRAATGATLGGGIGGLGGSGDKAAGWWRGESDANDLVGGNNGAAYGGVSYTTAAAGHLGQAFSFNGNNSYISFGTNAGNFRSCNFMVDFWMKTAAQVQQSILDKRPTCNLGSWWDVEMTAAGRLVVNLCGDSTGTGFSGFYSTHFVNDSVWHHIVVQRVGTVLTLYVDGEYDNSSTTAQVVNIDNNWPMYAGKSECIGVDGATHFYSGQLDEIRMTVDSLGYMSGVYLLGDQLHLRPAMHDQFPFINVACSDRGTVARIATKNVQLSGGTVIPAGTVVGEYRTSPVQNDSYFYPNPSRTTVDQYGNVWVANRYDSSTINSVVMGSVTRVALIIGGTRCNADRSPNPTGQYLKPPFDYCTAQDRDGDGLIKTSRGHLDILPWSNARGDARNTIDTAGGVSTAEDEAITAYVRVLGDGTRTVAVDRENDIWVGGIGFLGPQLGWHQKLDGLNNRIYDHTTFNALWTDINSGGQAYLGGYGGVIDRNGVLWSSTGGGPFLRFVPPPPGTDPGQDWSPNWMPLVNGLDYGLAVDPLSGKVWSTQSQYFPANGEITRWETSGLDKTQVYNHGSFYAQGIAVDGNTSEGLNNVWVANSSIEPTINTIGHMLTDGTHVGEVVLPTYPRTINNIYYEHAAGPTGCAIDSEGKIWVTCRFSGRVYRINPAAGNMGYGGHHIGAIDIDLPGGVDLNDEDDGGNPGPWGYAELYNYSDMTGFNNRNSNPSGAVLKGYWTFIEDGGSPNTHWTGISWLQSAISGTGVEVRYRTGDDLAALFNVPLAKATSGISLNALGRYMEVRISLRRDSGSLDPYLQDLNITRTSSTLQIQTPVATKFVNSTGTGVFFSVTATGSGSLVYQWYDKNGNPIGPNSSTLTVPAGTYVSGDKFSVRVTDASGDTLLSGPAFLFVKPSQTVTPIIIPSGAPASSYPSTITVPQTDNYTMEYVAVELDGLWLEEPDHLNVMLELTNNQTHTSKTFMLMAGAGGRYPAKGYTLTLVQDGWGELPMPQAPTSAHLAKLPNIDQQANNGAGTPENYAGKSAIFSPAPGPLPPASSGAYRTDLVSLQGANVQAYGNVWNLYLSNEARNDPEGYLVGSWRLIMYDQNSNQHIYQP